MCAFLLECLIENHLWVPGNSQCVSRAEWCPKIHLQREEMTSTCLVHMGPGFNLHRELIKGYHRNHQSEHRRRPPPPEGAVPPSIRLCILLGSVMEQRNLSIPFTYSSPSQIEKWNNVLVQFTSHNIHPPTPLPLPFLVTDTKVLHSAASCREYRRILSLSYRPPALYSTSIYLVYPIGYEGKVLCPLLSFTIWFRCRLLCCLVNEHWCF